jgi:hypothetical protein
MSHRSNLARCTGISAVMMLGLFLGCSTAKAITVVIPSGPDGTHIDKTIIIMNPINGELATDLHAHLENAPEEGVALIGSAVADGTIFKEAHPSSDDPPGRDADFTQAGGTGLAPGQSVNLTFLASFTPGSDFTVNCT